MSDTNSQRAAIKDLKAKQKRKNMITIAIVAAVVIVVVLLIIFLPKLRMNTTGYAMQDRFSVGDPNAPVVVEEFSNYGCSHCKNFSENNEKGFIEQYVDTGLVYFTFYNYPFDNDGTRDAVEAAYCAADQNKFYQYKSQLFANSTFSGGFAANSLLRYAGTVGLDISDFQSCIDSNTHQAAIDQDVAYAKSLNVTGTPSFIVNGTLVYMNELNATVDAALAAMGN